MDAYTLHLLGMAVDACFKRDLKVQFWESVPGERWTAAAYNDAPDPARPTSTSHITALRIKPTLDAALAALLRDLGVEVPERPTAERRDEVWQHLNEAEHNGEFLDGMRDYPDRLAVLALLEEGS